MYGSFLTMTGVEQDMELPFWRVSMCFASKFDSLPARPPAHGGVGRREADDVTDEPSAGLEGGRSFKFTCWGQFMFVENPIIL